MVFCNLARGELLDFERQLFGRVTSTINFKQEAGIKFFYFRLKRANKEVNDSQNLFSILSLSVGCEAVVLIYVSASLEP